jgi:hypothetical protein
VSAWKEPIYWLLVEHVGFTRNKDAFVETKAEGAQRHELQKEAKKVLQMLS